MAVDALKDSSTVKRTVRRKKKPALIAVINEACYRMCRLSGLCRLRPGQGLHGLDSRP